MAFQFENTVTDHIHLLVCLNPLTYIGILREVFVLKCKSMSTCAYTLLVMTHWPLKFQVCNLNQEELRITGCDASAFKYFYELNGIMMCEY